MDTTKEAAKRYFGIWVLISQLPTKSKTGIGNIFESLKNLIDFASRAGMNVIQILPPYDTVDNPYSALSAFAGNIKNIDLGQLVQMGLIEAENIPVWFHDADLKKWHYIDYQWTEENYWKVLKVAYSNALESGLLNSSEYCTFESENRYWLDDYAFYMAYRSFAKDIDLCDTSVTNHISEVISTYKYWLSEEIGIYKFAQFIFFKQWHEMKSYANKKGITLIGDIPIYLSKASADVWAHPELFKVDENLKPYKVAGCPPDNMFKNGQLWGNPVYDWPAHSKSGYEWWVQRIKHAFKMFDILWIHHFPGFDRYWEISAGENTAKNGQWVDGPKQELFDAIYAEIPEAKFIVENLGPMDKDAWILLENLKSRGNVYGMNVLYFNRIHQGHWSDSDAGYTTTHNCPPIKVAYEDIYPFEPDTPEVPYPPEDPDKVARQESLTEIFGFKPMYDTIGLAALEAACKTKSAFVITSLPDIRSCGKDETLNTPGKYEPGVTWARKIPAYWLAGVAIPVKEIFDKYRW